MDDKHCIMREVCFDFYCDVTSILIFDFIFVSKVNIAAHLVKHGFVLAPPVRRAELFSKIGYE